MEANADNVEARTARSAKDNETRVAKVSEQWNGDIRLPYPDIWLRGRIVETEAQKDELADELAQCSVEAGLMQGERSEHPSKGRWGSCILSASRVGAGFLVHDQLGAAMHYGLRGNYDELGEEHDDEDFRAIVRGKHHRCRMFGTDAQRKENLLMLIWTSTPMDHVWRRIQLQDEAGNTLRDILNEETSPFARAGRMSVNLLTRDFQGVESDIDVLLHHIAADDMEKKMSVLSHFQDDVLDMNAHLWWRLARPYARRPFRNLLITDSRPTREERMAEGQRLPVFSMRIGVAWTQIAA
jgi:hypothetical protein